MEIALVYMAAGISSRFGGKIKQFVKVGPNQETLIEYSLKKALPAGFTKIIFIVGNKTEQPFREKFGTSYKGIPVEYALQTYDEKLRDKPWGTTDALCSLKDLDCPFVICNGDDLYGSSTFQQLVNHLKTKETCATIGIRLLEMLPDKGNVIRGIFEVENNKVKSIIETYDINKENLYSKGLNKESLANMNIFALTPQVLDELNKILQNFKQIHKGDRKIECLLPVEISNLIKTNKITLEIYSTTEKWLGITNPEDEEIVRNNLAKTKLKI